MELRLKHLHAVMCVGTMAVAVAPNIAAAQDIAAGQQKASLCARCHGPDGVTDNSLLPNLAGQNEKYFIKQMHDFKEKRRRSTSMREIAIMLTDDDIENLAAYFRSLRKE